MSDDKKDNLRMINGKGQPNFNAESMRKMMEELPNLILYVQLMAQIHKAKYDALINQGFSEPQALELCKHVF